jgi:hypothetical protein
VVKRIPSLIISFCLTFTFFLSFTPVIAQEAGPDNNDYKYYSETGHSISNDFLKFYLSLPQPEKIWGFPITEAFFSTTNGRVTQYFQKVRFELYPENPSELRVAIAPLGKLLYVKGKTLPVPESFPTCRSFPEIEYKVCYAFLDYFLANGGIPVFGYPISNFEIEDNLIIQYFQRAKMEWHPELPSGERVVLANLGEEYFNLLEDNRLKQPVLPNTNYPLSNLPQTILGIKLQAFPANAVRPLSGDQTLYIIVRDQNNLPVPEATATVIISYPSSRVSRELVPNLSDENGIIRFPFHYEEEIPGITVINVTVNYSNQLEAKTVTSFRIWW